MTADAKSKTYGDVNPALTYTSSGLVNGDTLSGLLATPADQYSDVGTYAIGQGSLANGNYAISYIGADLTIGQRALTVTADAKSKTYGDANPALTWTASGLVNGDTLSGGLSTSAGQYSDVGSYAIGQGTLDNGNYAISFTGADLEIGQRALTVTANDISRYYGAANPPLSWTASGLVGNDTLAGELFTAASRTSEAGTYAITQGSLAASGNYHLTFNPGILTVKMLLSPPAGTLGSQLLSANTRFGGSSGFPLPLSAPGPGEPGISGGTGSPVGDPRNDNTVVCDESGSCIAVAPQS